MHVADRLNLRDEAKQIGNHLGTNTGYESRVAEFIDKHRVMKRTGVPAIPEFLQVLENLLVVLPGARANGCGWAHSVILPPKLRRAWQTDASGRANAS